MSKKRVLFVFPTAWDARQLEACREAWSDRYEVVFGEPDDTTCPWDFDVVDYIDQAVERYRGTIDGVTSSSDYPGATVAGAIAMRLGLPGSPPETVIRCSHKYYSRLAQREVVPDATPAFQLIDPTKADGGARDLAYPCFIKPVEGAFSVMSRKLKRPEDLGEFLARPAVQEFARDYVAIFNRLVAQLTSFSVNGSFYLAESFLRGSQVTVEGYVADGDVRVLGVVDSIMHPGTGSFARFDYPSDLRPEIQGRMAEIARRVVTHVGLRHTLFNIELIYEPVRDTIHIVEVNPRLCGQFADLYRKVDGVSGYEVALALATGEAPEIRRGDGPFALATSFPLRTFRPVRVLRAPDAARVAEVERRHPGALVWWECAAGQELADFEHFEDGQSARYGVVNVGADSRTGLLAVLGEIRAELGYGMEPLGGLAAALS